MAQDYPSFREHTRAPLRGRVAIRFDDQPNEVYGFVANISEGGMFVEVDDPRPVGTMLKIHLDSRELGELDGYGEISWIRVRHEGPDKPVGIGIQFRHLEAGGRERLRVYVQRAMAAGESGLEP